MPNKILSQIITDCVKQITGSTPKGFDQFVSENKDFKVKIQRGTGYYKTRKKNVYTSGQNKKYKP